MGKWAGNGTGGFLNGVTGVLVNYAFESKVWNEGKDNEHSTLTMRLDILQEGATVPVKQFLRGGFFYPGNQQISADGLTLTNDREKPVVQADSQVAMFIDSLEAAEPSFAAKFDATNYNNFVAMIGARVEFKRVIDKKATEEFGKRKGKTKDGKEGEFSRDNLLVAKYLGQSEVKAGSSTKPAKATAAKKSGPASAPAAAAPAAPPAATATVEQLDEAIVNILAEAKDSTVQRASLNSSVVRYAALKKHGPNGDAAMAAADREAIRLGFTDAYLTDATERGIVKFDGKQITL